MKNERRFCVYFHKNGLTGEVFYVGIGTGYRPRRFTGRNEMWKIIVRKYGFRVEIVHRELTWDEACEYEKKYIKQFGRKSQRNGSLANLTDGGDGTPGCTWNIGTRRTSEQRERISKALKGRKVSPEALANSVAARKRAKEEREKAGIKRPKRVLSQKELHRIRTMNVGRAWSEERKKAHGDKLRGRKRPPELVKLTSEKVRGVPKSEEHRRKLSEATKRQWEQKRTWYYKS